LDKATKDLFAKIAAIRKNNPKKLGQPNHHTNAL
jgi:hypothetical protein